jgi:Tol biopolymer transport system component
MELFFLSDEGGQVDLWRIDPQGGSPERITEDVVEERWPAFSPDGRWLAFVSVDGDEQEIHLLNPSTGQRQKIADSASSDALERPSWLGDKDLLYAVRLSPHEVGLYLAEPGATQPLIPDGFPKGAAILGWSAAAGQIVLAVGMPGESSDLYQASITPSGELTLGDKLAVGFDPQLSPDGRYLAFKAPPYGDDPAGYLLEMATGTITPYNEDTAMRRWDHDLAWALDGSHFSFVRSSWAWTGADGRPFYVGDTAEPIAMGGEEGVYVGAVSGPTVRQITDVGYDTAPAWSPDGKWLALVANRDDFDHSDIWLINITTGAAQVLVQEGGSSWTPLWRP